MITFVRQSTRLLLPTKPLCNPLFALRREICSHSMQLPIFAYRYGVRGGFIADGHGDIRRFIQQYRPFDVFNQERFPAPFQYSYEICGVKCHRFKVQLPGDRLDRFRGNFSEAKIRLRQVEEDDLPFPVNSRSNVVMEGTGSCDRIDPTIRRVSCIRPRHCKNH